MGWCGRLRITGSEQQAIGWLKPEWEIEVNTITSNLRTGFGRSKAELYANASPTVTVEAAKPTVTVGEPLTLTAVLTDDELPTKKPPRGESRNRIPSLVAPDDAPKAPDNVQSYKKPTPPRNGLSLLWIVYRGPDDATFDPAGFQRSVVEEKAEESSTSTSVVATTADTADPTEVATSLAGDGWTSATFDATVTFDEPGTYTLKAVACDAMMMTPPRGGGHGQRRERRAVEAFRPQTGNRSHCRRERSGRRRSSEAPHRPGRRRSRVLDHRCKRPPPQGRTRRGATDWHRSDSARSGGRCLRRSPARPHSAAARGIPSRGTRSA